MSMRWVAAFSERIFQTETSKCKYLTENQNSKKVMTIDIGGPLDVVGHGYTGSSGLNGTL